MTPVLMEGAKRLAAWLDTSAFPLWATAGYDSDHGFFEGLDRDGQPLNVPVRARVNPRQIFSFAEAGLRGWSGDWHALMRGGLKRFDDIYLTDQGLYVHLADLNGDVLDPSIDIYDQAFALLSFAAIANARTTEAKPMSARAHALLSNLQNRFEHPQAGFLESVPERPLRSNPHMHLFEAAQAWHGVRGVDVLAFTALADELADLCLKRFINHRTGALHEYFDRDWNRLPGADGDVVEPGHQFEWAWLLARWSAERGHRREWMDAAVRLFDIGEKHGIDQDRGMAMMALGADFVVIDPIARLWSQTEWLKAALLLAAIGPTDGRARYLRSAEHALAAFEAFLTREPAGLWFDKCGANGRFFAEEPAPASTLYHIVCAITELEAWASSADTVS